MPPDRPRARRRNSRVPHPPGAGTPAGTRLPGRQSTYPAGGIRSRPRSGKPASRACDRRTPVPCPPAGLQADLAAQPGHRARRRPGRRGSRRSVRPMHSPVWQSTTIGIRNGRPSDGPPDLKSIARTSHGPSTAGGPCRCRRPRLPPGGSGRIDSPPVPVETAGAPVVHARPSRRDGMRSRRWPWLTLKGVRTHLSPIDRAEAWPGRTATTPVLSPCGPLSRGSARAGHPDGEWPGRRNGETGGRLCFGTPIPAGSGRPRDGEAPPR